MTETIPTRPSSHNEEIDMLVAIELLPKVVQWLRSEGETDIDEEELKKELADASFHAEDGYRFAKELEASCMWEVDSELVRILDNASFARHKAHKSLVKRWVDQYSVRPKFSVGQRVTFKPHHRHGEEPVTGEVTKVIEDEATYLVFCEALGHVNKGNGTYGVYVPYESAEAVIDQPSMGSQV